MAGKGSGSGSGSGRRRRRELLRALARELRASDQPATRIQSRLRYGLRLSPYLSVRVPGRSRIQVYCVGYGGRYAFLTGTAQVIRLDKGLGAAALAVAAAGARPCPAQPAAGQAAAAQPGS
jgi:hypothetical protein